MEEKIEKFINNLSDRAKGKKAEKSLKVLEGFKFLAENIKDIIFIQDLNLNIIYISPSVEELSGYKPEELIGVNAEKLFPEKFLKKAKKSFSKYLKRAKQNKNIEIPLMEFQYILKDKSRCWGEFKANFLYDSEDNPIATLGSLRDITKRKEREEKIKYLGFHDELTGLYNRHYFNEAIERLDTKRQLPLSVIMGDVNGLKLINDAFGHKKGDDLLQKIADILKNCCRKEDIISRWGGDEFVILLPQTSRKNVKKIARRIKNACKKNKNEILNSSIALGYSIKGKETQNIEDIIKEAEKRVYKHKLVESQSARSAIISSLVKMLREKLLETEAHSKRIKKLAVKMGRKLNLEDNKIDNLKLLANLHDIGKVGVPNPILLKPASLNKKEWKKVKKHSEIGYRIAQSCSQLTPISDAILYHHEWWDGSGYPRGLKKEEIPLISRIIAIIDAYDVMIHERPYTKTMNKKDAIHELKRRAGKQFDPHLVGKFIEIIKE